MGESRGRDHWFPLIGWYSQHIMWVLSGLYVNRNGTDPLRNTGEITLFRSETLFFGTLRCCSSLGSSNFSILIVIRWFPHDTLKKLWKVFFHEISTITSVQSFWHGWISVEVSMISFDRVIFIGYNVGTKWTLREQKRDGSIEKYRRYNHFQIWNSILSNFTRF